MGKYQTSGFDIMCRDPDQINHAVTAAVNRIMPIQSGLLMDLVDLDDVSIFRWESAM